MIDRINICRLSKTKNGAVKAHFNENGDAFAATDTDGNVVTFYLRKTKFLSIVKNLFPTSVLFNETNLGLLMLGTKEGTIQMYDTQSKQMRICLRESMRYFGYIGGFLVYCTPESIMRQRMPVY